MAYQYSLVRFVPDPARGEFVNIGAVAGDDQAGDWAFRTISNYQRARAMDLRGVLNGAISFAATLDERVAASERFDLGDQPRPLDLVELRLLSEEMQNIVQLSPPAPVVAESAEGALDIVFDRLIVDPARQQHRFAKKHQAQAATRRSYQEHGIPREAIKERARFASGVFDGVIDFAVHNGETVQLVQCWSFQLPNQDDLAEQVKSWAWVVHELRNHGGELRTGGDTIDIPSGLQIAAVCVPPKPEQQSHAFREAETAFSEIGVVQLEPDNVDQLGETAADLLSTAH